MDDKLKSYYKDNRLYRGHRIVLPEASHKLQSTCDGCKYFITVVGRDETRKVCVAGAKAFRTRAKRVPQEMNILDLIMLLGKEALEDMLNKGQRYQIACGDYENDMG